MDEPETVRLAERGSTLAARAATAAGSASHSGACSHGGCDSSRTWTGEGWSAHIAGLGRALAGLDHGTIVSWGRRLAAVLAGGGRLLVGGNGGSAAEAQHLTAELAGRHRDGRRPLAAVALHADTSTVTAVANDVSYEDVFAHQVVAHGRSGDILLVLSTSGQSRNLLRAVAVARQIGVTTWALTGPGPNPLAGACDEHVAVAAASVEMVQECHLSAVHVLCSAVDGFLSQGQGADMVPVAGDAEERPRLVVVGDVVLDRDVIGEAEQLAPEAPVPVVGAERTEQRPGGAGLCAMLGAVDGFEVTLVTALGRDEDGEFLSRALRDADVKVVDVTASGPTPVKTRIRTPQQVVAMVDQPGPPGRVGVLPEEGKEALAEASAVVVADYGRGVADRVDVREAVSELVGRVPVVWDPHPRGIGPVAGVDVVTPNTREAGFLAADIPGSYLSSDIGRARRLLERWRAKGVVVTRGREGAVLIDGPGATPLVVHPPFQSSGDPCGAGDRLVVSLARSLSDGRLLADAAPAAVAAGAAFVEAGRPSLARQSEAGRVDGFVIAEAVRRRGGTVVATGGCFDLLHRGHIATLKAARELGDCLVVCLNSDASVRRLKGRERPLVSADDRAEILTGLAYVDAVVVFDQDTPTAVLARLRPHFWVKGGDYLVEDIPERGNVEAAGGQVVVVPYVDGRSTTRLIDLAARRRAQVARSA